MQALQDAALDRFGDRGPALDLAGSTDSGIVAGMLAHFGVAAHPDEFSRFYATYLERLEWNLADGGFEGRVLPGVVDMLETLAADELMTVGLLTGNIEGGAVAKMRHYGLDHYFGFGAYGCDFADRNRLGPVALERATEFAGREFSASETLVIGDTPKDINCAKAMDARCLAVATGGFDVAALELAGADRVVASLVGALA